MAFLAAEVLLLDVLFEFAFAAYSQHVVLDFDFNVLNSRYYPASLPLNLLHGHRGRVPPLWFFVVMLLPENRTTPELAETIMTDVRSACEELDVAIGGGHTEITQGLDRPILVGQMLGEVGWR